MMNIITASSSIPVRLATRTFTRTCLKRIFNDRSRSARGIQQQQQHHRPSLSRRWINSARLTIEENTDTTAFDRRPAKEDLVFGTTLSNGHMLMIEWNNKKWSDPRIVPLQDLTISPAASSLHYGKHDVL